MFKLHLYFFTILTSLVVDGACYAIDDSDFSTLKYAGNPTGPQWFPIDGLNSVLFPYTAPNGTTITVDPSQCWNGTYAYNCTVQFSFTGSGITMYVLQAGAWGVAASLTVDSGFAISNTLAAPPAPQYDIPRVPIFNVQNLVSGNHTAMMLVLDWDGDQSIMMLDYIDVNQTVVASSTPTTTTHSTTASGSHTTSGAASATASASNTEVPLTSSKTNVAIIAGGVVGGVAGLLGLGALAWFCFRRHRRHSASLNEGPALLSPGPEPRFFQTARPFSSTTELFLRPPSGAESPLQDVPSTSTAALPDPTTSMTNNDSFTRLPTSGAVTFVGVSNPNPDNVPDLRASPHPVAVAAAGALPSEKLRQHRPLNSVSRIAMPSSGDPGVRPNSRLTDDQADFVNSLYSNNIPGPIVAHVLERMLANPQGGGSTGANDPELRAHLRMPTQTREGVLSWLGGEASEVGDGETGIGTAPPGYNFELFTLAGLCMKRCNWADYLLGYLICRPSPQIGTRMFRARGRVGGGVVTAVSSLRKLSSGGCRYPTAALPGLFKMTTN
ncbi:hypothetical protein BU15DRAFT_61915 [Melanogaster broomeanus]|nr:hypothetical protein BU15DRAFT_61915 [Melanogaster broomeanus]